MRVVVRSARAGRISAAPLVGLMAIVMACSPAPGALQPSGQTPGSPDASGQTGTPPPTPGTTQTPTPTPTPLGDPVLLTAGDIAACSHDGDSATAEILARYPDATVQTLGDNAYDKGTPRQFACYDDTWGVALERTHPALGGHDYMTPDAAGYFGYFAEVLSPLGATASDPRMGWYAYDLGEWRIIVLNSICDQVDGCDRGSPQVTWLTQELADHPATCSLAVIHNPRFSSGRKENEPRVQPLWEALHAAGVEAVLSGDNHAYERLAPMKPDGRLDSATGIRQFVVGTGGRSHYKFSEGPIHPNTETGDDDTFGVLKLTLAPDAYSWEFLPEAGKTYTDTGSEECH
jgi:acid phosphatase type 7